MSKRATIVLAIALAGAAAVQAKGPSRTIPAVNVLTQAEASNTAIVGQSFTVVGQGFRASLPVRVCISGDVCREGQADAQGAFEQDRSLQTAGIATVYVFQPRSKREIDSDDWQILATKTFNVAS